MSANCLVCLVCKVRPQTYGRCTLLHTGAFGWCSPGFQNLDLEVASAFHHLSHHCRCWTLTKTLRHSSAAIPHTALIAGLKKTLFNSTICRKADCMIDRLIRSPSLAAAAEPLLTSPSLDVHGKLQRQCPDLFGINPLSVSWVATLARFNS